MFKVMIVDDEPVIRKGLINFIDWNELECEIVYEAINGIDAMDNLPVLLPEIVVADIKMPGMNGIELAKYISENYPAVKVIILTGYADFAYAQSAIKYGVVDFVLKPTTTENILEAVNKAKKMISHESKINNRLPEIREKFFQDIINQILVDQNKILLKSEQYDICLDNFYVILFEIRNETPDTDSSSEDRNKFSSSIKNFLSLAFKNYVHYNAFITKNLLCTVINFSQTDHSQCMQELILRCGEILDTVNNFMKFTIDIGISNVHSSISGIICGYREALSSLSNKFYSDSHMFIYSNCSEKQDTKEMAGLNKAIDAVVQLIQSGDSESAVKKTRELLNSLQKSMQPIDHIKNIGILLCSMCSKLLANHNLNISKVLRDSENIYKQILECRTINSLDVILSSVIEAVSTCLSSSHLQVNYIVKKAMEYIKENYYQNIKLFEIAESLHVNGSYLSRIFRKETGETLTEYITCVRMEKAKELLQSHEVKAYEIASMVGIDDPAYFSQVFKKYTGVSPSDYKSMNSK